MVVVGFCSSTPAGETTRMPLLELVRRIIDDHNHWRHFQTTGKNICCKLTTSPDIERPNLEHPPEYQKLVDYGPGEQRPGELKSEVELKPEEHDRAEIGAESPEEKSKEKIGETMYCGEEGSNTWMFRPIMKAKRSESISASDTGTTVTLLTSGEVAIMDNMEDTRALEGNFRLPVQ